MTAPSSQSDQHSTPIASDATAPQEYKSLFTCAVLDRFEGVTLDLTKRIADGGGLGVVDLDGFLAALRSHVEYCRKHSLCASWLKLPATKIGTSMAGVCLDEGFTYHHVGTGYIMLSLWLRDGPSRLPGAAVSYLGAGGIVLNDNNEILLVQEKHPYAGIVAWKLPGGLVEAGESITDAAVREVLEETSIQTDPHTAHIAHMRENTQYIFGKTDLYFAVILRPLSSEIQIDANEISAACWMDVETFVSTPNPDRITKHNIHLVEAALVAMKRGTTWASKEIPLRPCMKFFTQHLEPSNDTD